MKQVLILYADAGFGHRSAALALKAALEETYADQVQVTLVNPMEDRRTPFFLRDSQTEYDKILARIPELYKIGYDLSDAAVPSTLMDSVLILSLYDPLRELIESYKPDAIVTTYPLYQAPLEAVSIIKAKSTPMITVVTDLASVHRLWFNTSVDSILVPTPQVERLAKQAGIDEARVKITGIPVHPVFSRIDRPKEEIRQALGWQTAPLTLLAAGSKRLDGLLEAVTLINHCGFALQMTLVAGGDDELFQAFQQIDWHKPVALYNFVDNMPELMHASDMILCKAGGLIVTEALATGLPMLLVNVLPGQETGNAEYVISGGAGALVGEPLDLMETLTHWLVDDGAQLQDAARNARYLGKPEAAFLAAREVWEAAQGGPHEHLHILERSKLVKTLKKYHEELREWESRHLGEL